MLVDAVYVAERCFMFVRSYCFVSTFGAVGFTFALLVSGIGCFAFVSRFRV